MEIVLFSGHMVDAPGRARPRFPAERVPRVRKDIAGAIAQIQDPEALAISGLACGGDLLFAREWLGTGRPLRAFLPREVGDFLDESVLFAGEEWVEAFDEVVAHPGVAVVGPDEEMLGLEDPHTANNLRMLDTAIEIGDEVHGLFLWDGKGGDGPGGTQHLISKVLESDGGVTILHP